MSAKPVLGSLHTNGMPLLTLLCPFHVPIMGVDLTPQPIDPEPELIGFFRLDKTLAGKLTPLTADLLRQAFGEFIVIGGHGVGERNRSLRDATQGKQLIGLY